eukprot:scaffold276244_cov36-Prasinocladus_malaysianus.AAC.1
MQMRGMTIAFKRLGSLKTSIALKSELRESALFGIVIKYHEDGAKENVIADGSVILSVNDNFLVARKPPCPCAPETPCMLVTS